MHEDVYPFGRKKVFIERFRDPRELIETTKGRNPPTGSYYSDEHDFIAQDIDLGGDEWRGGYSRSSDALYTFEHGTTDRKANATVHTRIRRNGPEYRASPNAVTKFSKPTCTVLWST